MLPENKIVNSLWIGSSLSRMEWLTIRSFLQHGHEFHLWLYESIELPECQGLRIRDASQILPKDRIFTYNHHNQYHHGKGSVAGFSDLFRYKLLYESGGWWVDMDVTCLRPLDFSEPYFFREHNELSIVGNVMKCPSGSALMKACYEEANVELGSNNKNWLKPIEILNKHITALDLDHYMSRGRSLPDHFKLVEILLNFNIRLPEQLYFVHWMNEVWRAKQMNKNDFMLDSTFGQLMTQHGLVEKDQSAWRKLLNKLTHFELKIYFYRQYLFNPFIFNSINTLRTLIKTFLRLPQKPNSKNRLTPEIIKSYKLS